MSEQVVIREVGLRVKCQCNKCKPGPSCPRHPPGVSMFSVSMVRTREQMRWVSIAVVVSQARNTSTAKNKQTSKLVIPGNRTSKQQCGTTDVVHLVLSDTSVLQASYLHNRSQIKNMQDCPARKKHTNTPTQLESAIRRQGRRPMPRGRGHPIY